MSRRSFRAERRCAAAQPTTERVTFACAGRKDHARRLADAARRRSSHARHLSCCTAAADCSRAGGYFRSTATGRGSSSRTATSCSSSTAPARAPSARPARRGPSGAVMFAERPRDAYAALAVSAGAAVRARRPRRRGRMVAGRGDRPARDPDREQRPSGRAQGGFPRRGRALSRPVRRAVAGEPDRRRGGAQLDHGDSAAWCCRARPTTGRRRHAAKPSWPAPRRAARRSSSSSIPAPITPSTRRTWRCVRCRIPDGERRGAALRHRGCRARGRAGPGAGISRRGISKISSPDEAKRNPG